MHAGATALAFVASGTLSIAAVRSGKAELDWLSVSATAEPGKPVQTALRLVVDAGWHTYWENPGEGGMRISATWDLPAGWTAGALEHPVPQRFMTGKLAGFGYAGMVVFPVQFTPPAEFTGTARLRGKISWLTCNDLQCIPGDAELELQLTAGSPVATPATKWIEQSLRKIPRRLDDGMTLTVVEKPKSLVLTIQARPDTAPTPDACEIFPATPQAVDSAAKIQFSGSDGTWTAEVPKSEYLTEPLKELVLVLAAKSDASPRRLTWQSKRKKSLD